jgi:ribonuclease HI
MSGANNTAKVNKPVTYYGVANGLVPGVYTDYASVLAQTNGVSGAKHKSFTTREEAQAFVNDFQRGRSAPISLRGDLSETSSMVISKELKAGDTSTKKSKKTETVAAVLNGDVKWEPGYGPIPPDAEDGFDPTIKLDPDTGNIRVKTEQELSMTKLQPTGDISGPIVVYTDGSSLGNGKIGAVGGVGVYFGPNDARSVIMAPITLVSDRSNRNLSEALRGSRQTNQRAELTAVARALDHIPIDRSTIILTDSRYSIQCLTEWFPKWEKNNWKSSSGKDVENRDLIEPIIARMRERAMCKAQTKLEWLKGHANHPGNVAADRLAVQGSRTSTPELRSVKEFSATLMTPIGVEQRIETMHESQQVAAAGSLGNAWQPQTTSQAPSMSWSAGADDGGAEFDEIFAELAAEREQLPPSVAVTQLSEAGAKEGQATDAMDVARDGGEGA